MKQSVMLTIASLLSILLLTLHITDVPTTSRICDETGVNNRLQLALATASAQNGFSPPADAVNGASAAEGCSAPI